MKNKYFSQNMGALDPTLSFSSRIMSNAIVNQCFNIHFFIFRGAGHFFIFRGAGPGCNTTEISNRLIALKKEISDLEAREQELDTHKLWVQQSIKNVTDDMGNHKYPCRMSRAVFTLHSLHSGFSRPQSLHVSTTAPHDAKTDVSLKEGAVVVSMRNAHRGQH
jgi:hypothetical protein